MKIFRKKCLLCLTKFVLMKKCSHIYIYIYIYICRVHFPMRITHTYTHTYIYIYIYIEREREREIERLYQNISRDFTYFPTTKFILSSRVITEGMVNDYQTKKKKTKVIHMSFITHNIFVTISSSSSSWHTASMDLTVARHPSLSSITPERSSKLYSASTQSCCI